MDELRRRANAQLQELESEVVQLSPSAAQELIHELRVHQIELQMQNEELRRTQVELERARRKYLHLYDFAPCGYCSLDRDGTIRELNLTLAQQLGADKRALLNAPLYHRLVEEDRDSLFTLLRNAFDRPGKQRCELRMLRQDGSSFWAQLDGQIVETESLQECRVTITDISERKQAEETLHESEARYHAVIDSQEELICRFDRDGVLTFVNPAYCRYFGKTIKDLLGQRFMPLIPENEQQEIAGQIAGICLERPSANTEHRVFTPGGGLAWLAWCNRGIFDEEGRLVELQAVGRDITLRKQQEQELLAITHRLQRVIETVGEGITLSDEDGYFLIFNPSIENIFGYSRREANETDDFLSLLYPKDEGRAEVLEQMQDVLNFGGERTLETRICAKNGRTKVLLVSTTMFMETGKRYFLSAYRDITHLKEVEKKLTLEARSNAELLREVNHRVGNNLMAISGLLSLERRHLSIEGHEAYQEILEDLSSRVSSLAKVHEMLSFSAWTPLELDDLCREVLALSLQQVPASKSVLMTVTPSTVRISPKQAHNLALMLNELATNSIKYALTEQERLQLHISITEELNQVLLEFRDDGPGYPADVLNFERYNVGIDLLQKLSRADLRGRCSLRNDSGAVASVQFPQEQILQGEAYVSTKTHPRTDC